MLEKQWKHWGIRTTPRWNGERLGLKVQGQSFRFTDSEIIHWRPWCLAPGTPCVSCPLSGSVGPRLLQPMEIMRSREKKGEDKNRGCPVHSPGIRVTNTWKDARHLVLWFFPISPAKIQIYIFWTLSTLFVPCFRLPELELHYFVEKSKLQCKACILMTGFLKTKCRQCGLSLAACHFHQPM